MATRHYDAALGRFVATEPRKPRRVRVYLEDGSYILAPKSEVQHLVGITEYGDFIVRTDEPIFKDGEYLGLTSCCGATAKGCDGYVGCRMCYDECDTALGAPLRDSDIYLKVRTL
jgi:hypothetical protein